MPQATPSELKDTPTPFTVTTTNLILCGNESIHAREIVAWFLTVLLTILLIVLFTVVIFVTTIRNVYDRKRNLPLRRKGNRAQEEELEDNPGYEATSNARPSLCEVMDNPCYITTEANRVSETQSGLYESIKLDHIYVNS
jgi:hypothetical protein